MNLFGKATEYLVWLGDKPRLDDPEYRNEAASELSAVLADVRAATILECNMRLTRMGLEEEKSS